MTTDPATLLPNLRTFLVSAGVVRVPRIAGSAPPLWLDPAKGVPYPRQTTGLGPNESSPDLVLAAYPETGIPSGAFMGFYVQAAVTLWYRGVTSPLVQAKHEQIRALLHDKRNYLLGDLQVNQSMLFRERQRIGSDERGYTYNCEYMFDLWGP